MPARGFMRLFGRSNKDAPQGASVDEVEAQVKAIRARIGSEQMPLSDLFALLGEDEREALRATALKARAKEEALEAGEIDDRPKRPSNGL
jgi:hypothetical protein